MGPVPENELVLWITGQRSRSDDLTADLLPEAAATIVYCPPDGVERWFAEQPDWRRPPVVVVLGSDCGKPLRLARLAYRRAPQAQILFLVEDERLAQFRSELAVAPMIGTYWTIVPPQPSAIAAALPAALKTSRQRRQLRTSLDAINVRLTRTSPPRDSSEYRKLVISDKYLATILEHAQDAIVSLDPLGRIVSWNRGAIGLFGYSSQSAVNLRVADLVSGDRLEDVRSWFASATSGTPVVQREVECCRADGETFTAEVTLAPVRAEGGEVVAVSLTARDVSERKRSEEELRRIQAELEDRVMQRTEELRSVNKELEAFTYSASHDLRAPLRGIDGFSQALLEDFGASLEEPAKRYIERIRTGAQRMGEIIDSLLMLSRISLAELHLGRVDLTRMAHEIAAELREEEPGRNIELEVQQDLVVRADPQLMRIALQNLLGNAWKFSRGRDPAIIEFGRLDSARNGDATTYFVRDNGAGFDMAYSDKLFAPFQRIHHPSAFEGTGIGLGTVQRVMMRHGGSVWGEGTPGSGATFYFRLPNPVTEGATSTAT